MSESNSITSPQTSLRNPYKISYLLKRIQYEQKSTVENGPLEHNHREQLLDHKHSFHQQKFPLKNITKSTDNNRQQIILLNIPIDGRSQTQKFYLEKFKQKDSSFRQDNSNKQYYIKQQKSTRKFLRHHQDEKQEFNNTAYCVAYCTIIVIGTLINIKGVTIGGWIGGLFELISSGHNACNNEYRGHLKCQIKYASLNVTTYCINIFYKNSVFHNAPFICLCRFRNNSHGKYRDCEFLHANIQYI